jgi:hypothetical protein
VVLIWQEAEETEAVKRKRGLTAKVQYRREMILGYDEDASDDDADHPQSNQAHLTLSELRRYGLARLGVCRLLTI